MSPKIETEIAVIKEQLKYVIESVDKIQNNHLTHIYERLGKIENRIAYSVGGLGVLMIVINIVLSLIK